jgi:hypothetical protein
MCDDNDGRDYYDQGYNDYITGSARDKRGELKRLRRVLSEYDRGIFDALMAEIENEGQQ